MAAFKKLSLAQLANLTRKGEGVIPWKEWKEITVSEQRDFLGRVNADRRKQFDLAKEAAAAQKRAKKTTMRGSKASAKTSDGGADAFTRQGRMSQADWNETFHS